MDLRADADLVVVGSGVAGLSAALEAADRGARVRLVTAGPPLSGSSRWAQGGIAAARAAVRPAAPDPTTISAASACGFMGHASFMPG
jgi:L-aspartate oxidase